MIIKKVDKKVDEYLKKPENRIKLYNKNNNAFLDKTRLKFAVVNPFTLKYDCSLIFLAYSHSSFWMEKGSKEYKPEYYEYINAKAKVLLLENGCKYEKNNLRFEFKRVSR